MILYPFRHRRFRDFLRLVSPNRESTSIRIGLVIGSFIIYAAAVMVLREHRFAGYNADRVPVAAAVSDLVYGAPIGTIYSGLLGPFLYKPLPIQQALEETARGRSETGPLLTANPDGNGIGYTLFATLAMRLFGLHLSSLTFALLCLMGISTFAFLLRYQDDRVIFVLLYFFSLTVMLFTPLVTAKNAASEIPVGGIRYFSLLGILPAMHIFWEIAGSARPNAWARPGNYILLAVQVLMLAIVILIRGSSGYLLGALVAAFFALVGARRRDPAGLRKVLANGAFIAMLSVVLVASFYLWVPQGYKESGRITGIVWHRMLISLGANPAWPFGDLRDVYASCENYADSHQGLVPHIDDSNGGCIWEAYAFEHRLPPAQIVAELYDGRYEMVLRKAFLGIVRRYPTQIFETLFYYKPIHILTTMRRLMGFGAPGKTLGIKLLLIALALALAQAAALVAFVAFGASGAPENHMRLLIRAMLLFLIFAIAPLLVAWSNPFTSAELVFYIFSGLAVALIAIFDAIRRSLGA